MLKKILLIFLFPLMTLAQQTKYSPEQEQIVKETISEIRTSTAIDIELAINNLSKALDKVPNHPDLVYELLRIYTYGIRDFEFVANFCKNLELNYLIDNQRITVEFCASAYKLTTRYDYLIDIIPIIEAQDSKDLFNAFYYLWTENFVNANKYSAKALNHNFQIKTLKVIQENLLQLYIAHLNNLGDLDSIYKIMMEHKEKILSIDLVLNVLFIVTDVSLAYKNYSYTKDLINYSMRQSPKLYRYMSIIKSYIYSLDGFDDLTISTFEKALTFDDDAFDVIFDYNGGVNLYPYYIKTLNSIDGYDTRLNLVDKMSAFFEGRNLFTTQTKLYKSFLFASKNKQRAMAVLDSLKEDISTKDYENFSNLIEIENELYNNKPNYKKVNKLLFNFEKYLDELEFLELKYNFQNVVNIEKNMAFFDAEQMISNLDRIITLSQSEEEKQKYTFEKIQVLILHDLDRAYLELEKLGMGDEDKKSFVEKNFNLEFTKEKQEEGSIQKKSKNTVSPKGLLRFSRLEYMLEQFIYNVSISN